jgi:ketosteroid isomerase-like protein
MTNTPGRAWFERQLAYLAAKDVDGLVAQYHDDANLLFDIKGQIKGRDAIREFFVEHLEWLGRVELKSIDAFTETGNSCFAEVRLLTAAGEGRVVDTFVLQGDKVRLHFNGLVSFIPIT